VKAFLTKLNESESFASFIKKNFHVQKFICSTAAEKNHLLKNSYIKEKKDPLILIVPEGDFSPAELDSANKNGFEAVSLGDSRLRTETAGIAACHTISLLNQ